jgi:hypothetical protein
LKNLSLDFQAEDTRMMTERIRFLKLFPPETKANLAFNTAAIPTVMITALIDVLVARAGLKLGEGGTAFVYEYLGIPWILEWWPETCWVSHASNYVFQNEQEQAAYRQFLKEA